MRVFELARDLKLESSDVLALAKKQKISVATASSGLEADEVHPSLSGSAHLRVDLARDARGVTEHALQVGGGVGRHLEPREVELRREDQGGVAQIDRRVLDIATGFNLLLGPLVLRIHFAWPLPIGVEKPTSDAPVTNVSLGWIYF